MKNSSKGLADLFTQKDPFEIVDLNSLDFTVQEELVIASETERVKLEMIDLLTSAVMKKYSCSQEDVYKYWGSFKENLVL